jgi:predicted permease
VALLTGLTIKPLAKNDFSWPLISCSVLVLVLEPLLAYHFKLQNGNKDFSTILLLLLGSMPSSPLAIAFSLRYGCNVALASKLVVGTSIICGVTLPIISYYYS